MTIRVVRSVIAATALVLGAQGLGASEVPKAPTLTGEDARKAVATVSAEVERIRGLTFRKPVAVDSIDDARARTLLTARLKKFISPEKLRADTTAWALLGLVPPGTDLLATVLDVLEEQAGGFYDPATKRFFLLDDMPAAMAPALAAHELTHALEDQYYDLDKRLTSTLDDEDAMFAKSAVHEGSAMIVMALHFSAAMASGAMKAEDFEEFSKTEAARAESLRRLPQALQRQFIGPYLLGMNFLLRGDPAAVTKGFPKGDAERAYRRGPVSSEQVIHPEKFWNAAKLDVPKKVSFGGAGESLGATWRKTGGGVLGELLIAVVAGAAALDPLDAATVQDSSRWTNAAAAGWGGDRWELWSDGEKSVVLLATAWDTEKDAEEFARSLTPRPGFAWRQSGSRVGIVAGDAAGPEALLARIAP